MKTTTLGIHDKEAIAKMIAHVESECSVMDTEKLSDALEAISAEISRMESAIDACESYAW